MYGADKFNYCTGQSTTLGNIKHLGYFPPPTIFGHFDCAIRLIHEPCPYDGTNQAMPSPRTTSDPMEEHLFRATTLSLP